MIAKKLGSPRVTLAVLLVLLAALGLQMSLNLKGGVPQFGFVLILSGLFLNLLMVTLRTLKPLLFRREESLEIELGDDEKDLETELHKWGFRKTEDQWELKKGSLLKWSPIAALTSSAVLVALFVVFPKGTRQGRYWIQEGQKRSFAQGAGEILREEGRPIPGFFDTGHEIHITESHVDFLAGTLTPEKASLKVELRTGDRLDLAGELAAGKPLRTGAESYTLTRVQPALVPKISLKVLPDSNTELFLNQTIQLDGAEVTAIGVERNVERSGDMVRLKYREHAWPEGKTQEFWLFENFPNFDTIKRKSSRYHFQIASIQQPFMFEILYTEDPFWILRQALIVVLIVSVFFFCWFSATTFQISVKPEKILLRGLSSSRTALDVEFHRWYRVLTDQLKSLGVYHEEEDDEAEEEDEA